MRPALWMDLRQLRVDRIADAFRAGAWHKAAAGAGSKGPRWYDWAVQPFGSVDERGWRLWLLVRRAESGRRAGVLLCRGPAETPWRELVRAAGARWAVEECFERAKEDCGLDEYEVRSWTGWHRHVTLSMFALAVVTVIRSRAASAAPGPRKKGAAADPADRPEVRRSLLQVVWDQLTPVERALAWSDRRRAHQQHAKECHYKKGSSG